jgi:hypothetical protein
LNFGFLFAFATIDFLAICYHLYLCFDPAEREPEGVEKCLAGLVIVGGGHDRDVHPSGGGHLVEVDLGEDQLL